MTVDFRCGGGEDTGMSGEESLFEDGWVHSADIQRRVNAAVSAAIHRYPSVPPLSITVRWPTAEEGCWCYRNGRGFEGRPHPHEHSLGGCPIEPAHDRYMRLTIAAAVERTQE